MFLIVNGIQVHLNNYIDDKGLVEKLEKDESFISDVSYGFEKELSWAEDDQSADEILEMVVNREIRKRVEKVYMNEVNNKTIDDVATHLAKFIANNFHCCPIDVNVNVKDCGWWNSEKCYKCLLENAQHVKITR